MAPRKTESNDESASHIRSLAQQWIKGKVTLGQMMDLTPEELYAIASFGYLLFMQGKFDEARVIFEGLIAISPRQAYYYRALGSIYVRLKEPERAIRQYTNALKVEPNNLIAYIQRAEVYVSYKKFPLAKRDLMIVLKRAQGQDNPLVNKARAILKMVRT